MYGDPKNAERQQNQPHKWVSHKCEQCQRPANHEQKAPGQKCEHWTPPLPLQCKVRERNPESSAGTLLTAYSRTRNSRTLRVEGRASRPSGGRGRPPLPSHCIAVRGRGLC